MKRFRIKDKHLLAILLIICAGLFVFSIAMQSTYLTARSVAGRFVVPLQRGVNTVGEGILEAFDGFRLADALAKENRTIKDENAQLKSSLSRYEQMEDELHRLEALYELDTEYPDYEKVAARVIAKDPGNWYARFTIDKGERDGVLVDMNVLAEGGLYGIVTEVGPNWAKVRTIIDDENNISAMTKSSSDILTVTGSLLDYRNGTINFYGLRDADDKIIEGEEIVTSDISEKYLPGFTIGHITYISKDANNLTKSGTITPVASFDTIREVLVVMEVKEEMEEAP